MTKELIEHTNQQRQEIKEKYLSMYGKTLEEDLKSELGGEFEHVAVALLMPRYEYDAHNLRKAIKVIIFYLFFNVFVNILEKNL